LGKARFADKECQVPVAKKAQLLKEEDARREAARTTAVELKRAMTLFPTLDLHAMRAEADAVWRERGLPAHTMESFLHHMRSHVNNPQAAHQNEAPQDNMEHALHLSLGRS